MKLDKNKTREIIYGDSPDNTYTLVKDEITSSDPEDGGADHTLIIKRNADNKYFRLYYSDWDMQYNFERDFPENFKEVVPKTKTITVYE